MHGQWAGRSGGGGAGGHARVCIYSHVGNQLLRRERDEAHSAGGWGAWQGVSVLCTRRHEQPRDAQSLVWLCEAAAQEGVLRQAVRHLRSEGVSKWGPPTQQPRHGGTAR